MSNCRHLWFPGGYDFVKVLNCRHFSTFWASEAVPQTELWQDLFSPSSSGLPDCRIIASFQFLSFQNVFVEGMDAKRSSAPTHMPGICLEALEVAALLLSAGLQSSPEARVETTPRQRRAEEDPDHRPSPLYEGRG